MTTKVAYLRPLALGFNDDSAGEWTKVGAGGEADVVDPLYDISHDDAQYQNMPYGTHINKRIGFTLKDKPGDILTVTTFKILVRHFVTGNPTPDDVDIQLSLRLRTTEVDGTLLHESTGNTWIDKVGDAEGNPLGGLWMPRDIADPTLEIVARLTGMQATNTYRLGSFYVELTYVSVPVQDRGARDAASRRHWLFLDEPFTLKRRVPIADGLKPELNEIVRVSHRDGPHASGEGWRSETHQTRPMRLIARTTDLNANTCDLTLQDVRSKLCLLRYTSRTKSPAVIADGMAFITNGGAIVNSRSTVAYVADPSGGDILVRVEVDQLTYGGSLLPDSGDRQYGLMLSLLGGNAIIESSYRNQLTGWTTAGDGVNGSAVTAETSPLRFAQTESGFVAKLLAGTTHTTDLTFSSTAVASYAADSVVSFACHYQTAAGATSGPGVSIQRGFDSEWYTAASQTWGASKVVNPLSVSDGEWNEYYISAIDVGSDATDLTAVYTIEAGEPDGSEYYIGHTQIELSPYPQGVIVTEATAQARGADNFHITNSTGSRCVTADKGVLQTVITPSWNAADLVGTGTTHNFLNCQHDANNGIILRWSISNARWEVEYKAATTTYTAYSADDPPARGVPVTIVGRWTDSGELGIDDHTVDIFVNGVKGTNATKVTLTETSNAKLFFARGLFADTHSFAHVLTDAECARLPRA